MLVVNSRAPVSASTPKIDPRCADRTGTAAELSADDSKAIRVPFEAVGPRPAWATRSQRVKDLFDLMDRDLAVARKLVPTPMSITTATSRVAPKANTNGSACNPT